MNTPINVDRFFVIFTSIVYEAMPFIILGALISGTLEELLPQQWLARVIPRRRWLAIAGSALLGLIFPMCECGIVPVMRRLLGKGLPLSCAVAYMLAAPIINPVVIGSTWAAFSGDRSRMDGLTSIQMVLLRTGMGFVTAFIVGSIVARVERRRGAAALVRPIAGVHHHHHHDHHHEHGHGSHEHHGHPHHHAEHKHVHAESGSAATSAPAIGTTGLPMVAVEETTNNGPKKTIGQRLINISDTALRDFVDILCFLIIGALLAAFVQTLRLLQYFPELSTNPVLSIPIMMLLAVLLCLCSEADAFVAANLIQIPLGGKIAFLVLGPMLDLKLYMMYTRVFRRRLIWTVIPTVALTVFLLSLAVQYVYPLLFPPAQ